MKKNSKVIIVLIIIILIYCLILYFFLGGSKRVKSEKNQLVLIVGQSTMWSKSKNHWTNITLDKSISELNWKKYTIYIDNKKLGNYYMWYDNSKWYLFDKDRNSINYDGELFAYNSNYDINYTKFNVKDIEDYSHVEEFLDSKKLSFNKSSLITSSQIDLDIDNDGKEEQFYIISNSSISLNDTNNNYSIVFMVKDNKIYNMYSEIKDEKNPTCIPYISEFIDINQDNKLETIVGCESLDSRNNKKFLYQLTKENKYKILVSNR